MKIRAGYEISYDCPQPTPMILTLSVHPSRIARSAELGSHATRSAHPRQHLSRQFRQLLPRDPRPRGPADNVHGLSGAGQRRAGRSRPAGRAACTRRPAGGGADLSARQPLLRDRSPVGFGVVAVRSGSEGLAAGAGDLRLCPRSHHVRLRAREPDKNGVGRPYRAARRVPRLRPPRGHAVPLHEHSGALLHRLSRRHRRAARRCRRWISAPGSKSISAAAGTRSTPATTRRASAAS